ncbi:unnamed protein product [Haemonchus placei]|uniref:Uncharacterized protein n=1 Tax=Haemonchus placei TaxID=6290 RepID=A0A0N4WDA2_HAEPC|nr:unnamed protein product [Haemonchus placei]
MEQQSTMSPARSQKPTNGTQTADEGAPDDWEWRASGSSAAEILKKSF